MGWLVAVAGWNNVDTVREFTSERFDCYFPRFRERVVFRGKKIWRDRYLFGRYFFVRLTDCWVYAFQTPSISRILMSHDCEPAVVGDDEILGLRRREVNGYVPVERKRFSRGDRVKIIYGSMSGLSGVAEPPGKVILSNGFCVKVDDGKLGRAEG
jgi:transcription antitermination factor NusG